MNPILISTAYLPSINYFSELLKNETVFIEQHEHFIKQTYRNRCEILSSNGVLSLSIPLQKRADKEIISEKRISYAENWQINHWRAITSAYKNSAYFEYFEDEFKPFYFEEHEFLLEFNTKLTKLILHILRQKKELYFTKEYEKEFSGIDLRETLNIKQETSNIYPKYYQVFGDKLGFTPNLSVIDLLFNKGLETVDYLTVKI
ncbi:MAG: WbqC family protein [Bacteroidia bacterium]|nr:WbqC family protein [Bacteroidia bacterium]